MYLGVTLRAVVPGVMLDVGVERSKDGFFPPLQMRPKEHWGMRAESTGIGEKEFAMKIKMGVDFVGTTGWAKQKRITEPPGKALFPAECSTASFLQKYKTLHCRCVHGQQSVTGKQP